MGPVAVACCLAGCLACALAADEVGLTAQPDGSRLAKTAAYEMLIDPQGCVSRIRVGGQEFVDPTTGMKHGGYFFQQPPGPLMLTTLEQPAANVIEAKSDKAAARYEFLPDRVKWTLTNLTDQPMLFVMIMDPGIQAVHADDDIWYKPPTEAAAKSTTWYRDAGKLTLTGSRRIWGPWVEKYAIWEVALDPHGAREVVLTAGAATAEEQAQANKTFATGNVPPPDPIGPMWDLEKLSQAPQSQPAEGFTSAIEGIRAIYYEGLPWHGKPTRVFAWVGLPKMEPGQKVPGIVLVHGGGGTAFDTWVKVWTDRGYAAISMDTCGCVPKGAYGNWERNPQGGPPGWGGMGQIDQPREDQWSYHAVADAVLADSLLRSLPEVDPERIGVTGISWGGYLCSMIAGVDDRFKFAAPVYGCGFTRDHAFAGSVNGLGKERGDRWMRWWDPSVYLRDARMPILWVTGTNDFAYWFPALQKSYRLPPGPRTLAVRLRMPHGHGSAGEGPEEIHAFADAIVNGGDPLPLITHQGRTGMAAWCTFRSKVPVKRAELLYTKGKQPNWPDRPWEAVPAKIEGGMVTAELPEGVTVWFINLIDERELVVSTEDEEM